MALILKLDLDIVKKYHHTKNEVSVSTHSKGMTQTDTHTGTQTNTQMIEENITSNAYAGGNKQKRWIFYQIKATNRKSLINWEAKTLGWIQL